MNNVTTLPKLLYVRDKILIMMETNESVTMGKRARRLPFIRLHAEIRLAIPRKTLTTLV